MGVEKLVVGSSLHTAVLSHTAAVRLGGIFRPEGWTRWLAGVRCAPQCIALGRCRWCGLALCRTPSDFFLIPFTVKTKKLKKAFYTFLDSIFNVFFFQVAYTHVRQPNLLFLFYTRPYASSTRPWLRPPAVTREDQGSGQSRGGEGFSPTLATVCCSPV